jgi:sulfite exporter TauE/SafE
MLLLTAFLTGILGSFHCVGMCGPIAFALQGKKEQGWLFYAGRLLYNFGRIQSYALLGIVSGAFGLGVKLAGIQQGLSIFIGILIIFSVVYTRWFGRGNRFSTFSLLPANFIVKLFHSKSIWAAYIIGVLNGFLPCGFVYIAILGATVTQGIWEGALFMACFGLGTLPMMYGISIVGQFLNQNIRSKFVKLSPVFALLIALLFILRGLNLGIPFVSPKLVQPQNLIENCE